MAEKSVIFFDLESDCTFRNCPGDDRSAQFSFMQVTCCCALSVESSQCLLPDEADEVAARGAARVWWRDEAVKGCDPFATLLAEFDRAELIVGYNALDFDFPLLRKHYGRGPGAEARYAAHRCKCLDPFARIRSALEFWPKLDALLEANGLPSKTGDGKEAVTLWELQKRDELQAYCAQDVALLARLCLRSRLRIPRRTGAPFEAANDLFGVASALLARRAAQELAACAAA